MASIFSVQNLQTFLRRKYLRPPASRANEADYLRRHREVLAPIPFRNVEQPGGTPRDRTERLLDPGRLWDQLNPRLREPEDNIWLAVSPRMPVSTAARRRSAIRRASTAASG